MQDNHVDENNRADFIRDMYRVYWSNMARSMEGVWKVLAPITVTGTILAGVHNDYLPGPLGIAIAFIVIIWALNVTIDLNAWHRRNLFFATKAEQVFLSHDDYGNLLPARYKTPKPGWITFYRINAATFVLFLVITVVYAAGWKLHDAGFIDGWLLPVTVLAVCLTFTWFNIRAQERSAQKHFRELFAGKEAPKSAIPGKPEDADVN